jgi:hypothetical protein
MIDFLLNNESIIQIRKDIGSDLIEFFKQYRISKVQFAKMCNLDFRAIRNVETGRADYYISSYIIIMSMMNIIKNSKSPMKKDRLYKSISHIAGNQICEVIETIVCDHMNLNKDYMKSKTRETMAKIARFICWRLEIDFTKMSTIYIGKRFNRDHASVLHGIKVLNDLIDTNDPLMVYYFEVKNEIMKQFKPITKKKKYQHNKKREYKNKIK